MVTVERDIEEDVAEDIPVVYNWWCMDCGEHSFFDFESEEECLRVGGLHRCKEVPVGMRFVR